MEKEEAIQEAIEELKRQGFMISLRGPKKGLK